MSGSAAATTDLSVAKLASNGNGEVVKRRDAEKTSEADKALVIYPPGTVGHLVQEEDLAAPLPAVARNKVVDEDEFTSALEHIVERDYFPHVARLRAEAEYLDAQENNDVDKMREISMRYSRTPALADRTPRFDLTPRSVAPTPGRGNPDFEPEEGVESQAMAAAKQMRLDNFLAGHTSEDNAAYEIIVAKERQKQRAKHEWLYKQEEKSIKPMPITDGADGSRDNRIEYWEFRPKNALMYAPEGAHSVLTKEQLVKAATKEIRFQNTRLPDDPFKKPAPVDKTKMSFDEMTTHAPGRINPLGQVITAPSPQVGGYGFVSTPIHTPGPGDTPLMTWGEIEGTPFRIETDIDMTPGPQFSMHPVSEREKLAKELSDKATNKKKSGATPRPSPYHSKGTPALAGMSPAAQKLAGNALKTGKKKGSSLLLDADLRSSLTPKRTDRANQTAPGGTTPARTVNTSTPVSLTDDLLEGLLARKSKK